MKKMTLRPHVGNCINFCKKEKLGSPTRQCQKSIGESIWKKVSTSNNTKTFLVKQNLTSSVDLIFVLFALWII